MGPGGGYKVGWALSWILVGWAAWEFSVCVGQVVGKELKTFCSLGIEGGVGREEALEPGCN